MKNPDAIRIRIFIIRPTICDWILRSGGRPAQTRASIPGYISPAVPVKPRHGGRWNWCGWLWRSGCSWPRLLSPSCAGKKLKLRSPRCPDNSYQCPSLPIPQAGQAVKTPDIESAYPEATLIPVYQNGKQPNIQRTEKQDVDFQCELTYISFQPRWTWITPAIR